MGKKLGQEVSKDKGSADFCNTRGYGSPTGRVILLKFQNILRCIQLPKPC